MPTLLCRMQHLAAGVLLVASFWPLAALAQSTALTPLPPQRPFDLDLPKAGARQAVPATPVPDAKPAAPAAAKDTKAKVDEPKINLRKDKKAEAEEEDDEEAPRFPRGLNPRAEPVFDPNERPDRSGISTDPGTSITCLPPVLKGVLGKVVSRFGSVKVTSTWRPAWRARRNSYHRRCQAMDFRVPGVRPREVLNFVRTLPETGGNKVYWNGLIHVDTGPRRSW
ncbi:MAG: YcbK family protein [Bosea sp. (in: a-proteobacteria)]